MARTVNWTEKAWSDLEQIADYIAHDSLNYAAALVTSFQSASRTLNFFAERGRVVPEFSRSDIREIFVHRYRMIYHVGKEKVTILAIVHGARNIGPDFIP